MAKKVELEEATCKPRIVSFFFLFTVRACFGRLSVDSPSKYRRSKEEKKGEEEQNKSNFFLTASLLLLLPSASQQTR